VGAGAEVHITFSGGRGRLAAPVVWRRPGSLADEAGALPPGCALDVAAELARIIFIIIPIIMKLLLCAFAASAAHAAVHKLSVRKTPITLAGVAEGALHTRGVLGALAREHAGYGGNGVVPISTLEDAQYYGPIGWGTPPQVRAEAGRLRALPAAR
jgi:hypothetical protein